MRLHDPNLPARALLAASEAQRDYAKGALDNLVAATAGRDHDAQRMR
jgi:hypothetical protein